MYQPPRTIYVMLMGPSHWLILRRRMYTDSAVLSHKRFLDDAVLPPSNERQLQARDVNTVIKEKQFILHAGGRGANGTLDLIRIAACKHLRVDLRDRSMIYK